MKYCRLLLILLLGIDVPRSFAQTLIESIDGVYVQKDTVSISIKEKKVTDRDIIAFDIPGFGDYLAEERVLLRDVVILFNDVPMSEFPAYVENLQSGIVRFQFLEEELTEEHRKVLYNLAGGATKEIRLGLKVNENKLHYPFRAEVYFDDIENWSTIGFVLIGAFILFFIIIVLRFPTLVKETLPLVEDPIQIRREAAYSLGKTQMVYWTFLVLASFIYIWSFTTDLHSINTTALILIGISSATFAGARILNKKKETEAIKNNNASNLVLSRLTKGSFIEDILSDADGVSINRLQVFIFNVIFGVAFLKSVILDYSMPSFDETQLLLLGISSGTYVFLKPTEDK